MSKRRYYVLASLVLGVVFAIATISAVSAQGGQQATVKFTLNDESTAVVQAGEYVTVSGSGYKRYAQLSVCREGDGCSNPKADGHGNFSELARYFAPGNRLVKVYEQSQNWNNSKIKATTYLAVQE